MTAYSTLKAKLAGFFHDLPDPATTDTPVAALSGSHLGPQVAERALLRKVYNMHVHADADATTARASLAAVGVPASEYPNGAQVISIKLRSAAITTHATAFFTDSFLAVGSDGVTDSTAATITSDSDVAVAAGGLITGAPAATTANKPYSALVSATVADTRVVPDGALVLSRAKAGAGVTLAPTSYEVVLEAL